MRRVFLILALVALTRAWTWGRDNPQADSKVREKRSAQTCRCEFQGGPEDPQDVIISGRLKEESFWLDKLEEDLKAVQENFENIVSKAKTFIQVMDGNENRVERLEGNRCGDNEFSCGEPEHQCIPKLQACDGVQDCRNGKDECKDTTCKNPAPAGSMFVAYMDGNDPCTQRKPTKIQVNILTSEPSELLPSVEDVRLSAVVTYNKDDSEVVETLNGSGRYTYGKRTLTIFPFDEEKLGVDIVFDAVNPRLGRGVFYFEATEDICAEFTVRRGD